MTDVNFTSDCWTSADNQYITVMARWITGWECHTRVLGIHNFSVDHTALNLSANPMELRLAFGITPRAPRLPHTIELEWLKSEDPLDHPTVLPDCTSNIYNGVEDRDL